MQISANINAYIIFFFILFPQNSFFYFANITDSLFKLWNCIQNIIWYIIEYPFIFLRIVENIQTIFIFFDTGIIIAWLTFQPYIFTPLLIIIIQSIPCKFIVLIYPIVFFFTAVSSCTKEKLNFFFSFFFDLLLNLIPFFLLRT